MKGAHKPTRFALCELKKLEGRDLAREKTIEMQQSDTGRRWK
jgi:hypothetical protein